MKSNHFVKASILMLVLVIAFVISWEFYWRNRGFTVSYNDDKVLWAQKRKEIYTPQDQSTVFIGGSRIKFDLDIPTWEKQTGEKAIQLALVGTPARLILRDLGNDKNFRGKLVIDVTEAQFFGIDSARRDKFAREGLEYYYKETPAQKASAFIDYKLESKIVFLEEGRFGLTALLNDIKLPKRAGVTLPPVMPKEFSQVTRDRQNFMTPMFLADPRLRKWQIGVWKVGIAATKKTGAIKGDTLTRFLKDIKASIDNIRSRGGIVVFVRPPSNAEYLKNENTLYPRKQYWDRILEFTNTPGIYYSDYPETSNFICPEISHLSPADAVLYTQSLVKILKEEKGWSFPKSSQLISSSYKQ